MHEPLPSEEYITIIDNKGRRKVQRVEYVVLDVQEEKVYVTAGGDSDEKTEIPFPRAWIGRSDCL